MTRVTELYDNQYISWFKQKVVGVLKVSVTGLSAKFLQSSSKQTRLSLGSLSLVLDLIMNKGFDHPTQTNQELENLDEPKARRNLSTQSL